MSTDFDINSVVAEFLKANLDHAAAIAKASTKSAKNFARSHFERTYSQYIQRLVDRHSKAKSFFVRADPMLLYDFFVPLDLHTPRKKLVKPTATDLGLTSTASILIGSGGSGKSMMMRHFLLSALHDRRRTPLFFELRNIGDKDFDITASLLNTLRSNGLDADEEYLELALEKGHFLVLLDGYDEIGRSRKKQAARSIQGFAERYPLNWIVVSSRPDAELQGWDGFTTWSVARLDLERAIELVERLPFDAAIKLSFIQALKKNLFQEHQSFLSNPLLLSIMLLTYHDRAHIPNKLSIFYNQAYESLFQKHDALKSGYKRERLTLLDIQEFARVFSAFSAQSFDRREFSFPSSHARQLLDGAKKLTNIGFDSEHFLIDAVQAVCLLVEEGMDVAFAHRSFQEYFAALFISTATPEQKTKLIKRFSRNAGSDQIISLLYEIDPYPVESHYFVPAIQKLKKSIAFRRPFTRATYVRYLRAMFQEFMLASEGNIRATIKDSLHFHALQLALFHCNANNSIATEQAEKMNAADKKKIYADAFQSSESLSVSSIPSASPLFDVMAQSGGMLGMQTAKALVEIEDIITARHAKVQESLDSLLRG